MLEHARILQSPKGQRFMVHSPIYGIKNAYFLSVNDENEFTVERVERGIPKNIRSRGYNASIAKERKVQLLVTVLQYVKENPESWFAALFASDEIPDKKVLENPLTGSQVVYLSESQGGHVLFRRLGNKNVNKNAWRVDSTGEDCQSNELGPYYEVYEEYANNIYLDAKLFMK